jgi:superfamily I DNA/RNA helicase
MTKHQAFFDTVESTPLTREQRVAAAVMEDRNLLVAAAGSGKTSTVVGKLGYALLTEQMTPSDILVLAFNTNATRELEERINTRIGERMKGVPNHSQAALWLSEKSPSTCCVVHAEGSGHQRLPRFG